ncbi:protease inhibitor I42 family protein [Kitasatospora sp. NPDC058190]|uniref:protease inhibitor I42 family protein n=1 Tax=Kitasatospora sp. NPDC058190 TaxID=3346371 RepID=UPI0036D93DAD
MKTPQPRSGRRSAKRRILLALAAVLAVAGIVGAVAVHRTTTGKLDHGTVFTASSGQLTVKPGELFSIEVFGYEGERDTWTVAYPGPDPAIVQPSGDEYVDNIGIEDLASFVLIGNQGSGGHYYFTFRARNPGQTTITVHAGGRDRFGGHLSSGSDQTSRQVTVDVR